jgi:hypothetical protein
VRGTGPVIAHVGAALVRWGPVPADLSVHMPSLEDALLGLLADGAGEQAEPEAANRKQAELVGGHR